MPGTGLLQGYLGVGAVSSGSKDPALLGRRSQAAAISSAIYKCSLSPGSFDDMNGLLETTIDYDIQQQLVVKLGRRVRRIPTHPTCPRNSMVTTQSNCLSGQKVSFMKEFRQDLSFAMTT